MSVKVKGINGDIAFIKQVHGDNALALDSFVFPRNAPGHLDLLARAGLRTFRGPHA